jgi:hypothetical protein
MNAATKSNYQHSMPACSSPVPITSPHFQISPSIQIQPKRFDDDFYYSDPLLPGYVYVRRSSCQKLKIKEDGDCMFGAVAVACGMGPIKIG